MVSIGIHWNFITSTYLEHIQVSVVGFIQDAFQLFITHLAADIMPAVDPNTGKCSPLKLG